MPYKVFLSYSWKNSAERIAITGPISAIENVELSVDREFVSLGSPIHPTINDMIDATDCFVALLTKEGLRSREVMDEITRAHDRKKLIIPILQKGIRAAALPEPLQDLLWVRYDPENFDAVIKELTTALRKLANSPAGIDSNSVRIEIGRSLEAKNILALPHPTTLRIFLGLSCGYWILTGPWPLLWLFITSAGNWNVWWSTATTYPHLYLHSTCVGLFLVLCLRYPLVAMFTSSAFARRMWITLPVLLALNLSFILHDVSIGGELYGFDPSGFWLPLSSALQMLAFMLSAAVVILTGLRTIVNRSRLTVDIKVYNRLFGTILYGILWFPMRRAYEQASPDARELLSSNSLAPFWIVIFVFILGEALLAFSVFYKQRRYVVPIFVMIVSTIVLSVTLVYPNACKYLFGKDGHSSIYLLLCGVGLVGYLGMTPYESDSK